MWLLPPSGSTVDRLPITAPDAFSALHRLPSDEIWHFYLGDPITLQLLHPDGSSGAVTLGPDILNGQHVQYVVPRDVWQGARLIPGGAQGFALFGTTMVPGFNSADFEGGERAALCAAYPQAADAIKALTRPDHATRMPPGL